MDYEYCGNEIKTIDCMFVHLHNACANDYDRPHM